MRDSEKRGASRNRAAGRRGFLPRGVRTRKRPLSIAVPEIAPIDERPPYAGIGVELRLARERRDVARDAAAADTRIQRQFLEAIEEGRFDELPGGVYVTGFLKTYAGYLGFDPEHVVEQFRQESTMALGPTKLVLPEPIAEPRRPRGMVVMLSLLAAAVLYGGWTFVHGRDEISLEAVTKAPERLLSLLRSSEEAPVSPEAAPETVPITIPAEAKGETVGETESDPISSDDGTTAVTAMEAARDVEATADTIGDTGATSTEPSAAAAPATATAGGSSAVPSETSEAQMAEDVPPETPSLEAVDLLRTEASQPSAAPTSVAAVDVLSLSPQPPTDVAMDDYVPQRFGGADPDARVVVRARVDSWVQVQGPGNELLLTRILRAGDAYHAPNRGDLLLTTGNVGGLEIIVDGVPLGPLGPLGEVRRRISLDAERLLALPAARSR